MQETLVDGLDDFSEDAAPPAPGAVVDNVRRVGEARSVVCVELARLVERWIRNWSRCTGRQSARRWLEAIHPAVSCHHFPPGLRLPSQLKSHHPSADTKLYSLVTNAHACEQLAQGCYLEADRPRLEPATFRIASELSTVKLHRPPLSNTSGESKDGMCY